jgi:hypothetical protein
MATLERPRNWDRTETQRRIRHPLHALSGYIRSYVLLEGAAVALIYLAICFWVWLLLDYGTFCLFGLDAVKWLDRTYPAETAFFVRALVLGLVVAGLVAVVAFKVLSRLFTEFSDGALALVLERRFPRQLGDRLITAVELADPNLSDKYGYSQEMVDFTIRAAAERVAEVPVTEVFNWRRLIRQWLVVAAGTIGVFLLFFAVFGGVLLMKGDSPGEYFWRFNRTASIWGKRNALLAHRVYWPTQAYVEYVRLQLARSTESNLDVVKVPRDEQRGDLQVRSFKWVIYDPSAIEGIRPLRLTDLKGWGVNASLLDLGGMPEDWPHWNMDLADLDPSVPTTMVSDDWTGMSREQVSRRVTLIKDVMDLKGGPSEEESQHLKKIEDWLNWRTWTVDQLESQYDDNKVRQKLRAEYPDAVTAIEDLKAKLGELSQDPATNWNIRKLKVDFSLAAVYLGKNTRNTASFQPQKGNRYQVSLGKELKESVRLYLEAEDFYPSPLDVVLVPPTQLGSLNIELDEPAYKYFRLEGSQDLLKGARYHSVKPLSLTGSVSQYDVLAGTTVKFVAVAERDLKPVIQITRPTKDKPVKDSLLPHPAGAVVKIEKVTVEKDPADSKKDKDEKPKEEERIIYTISTEEDNRTFSLEIPNVQNTYDFEVHFQDEDKVKGSRRIILRSFPDAAPKAASKLSLGVLLRMPPSAAESLEPGAGTGPSLSKVPKGYLVTPKALVPFKGEMKDDFGLTKMEWKYKYKQVHFSLFGQSEDPKLLLRQKVEADMRAKIAAARVFQHLPLSPPLELVAPVCWQMTINTLEKQIAALLKVDGDAAIQGEAFVPMETFDAKIKELDNRHALSSDLFLNMLNANPQNGQKTKRIVTAGDDGPPVPYLPRNYSVHVEQGFDVQKTLWEKFRPKGTEVQKHFVLQIWMRGTDNNVESGPGISPTEEPVNFLIISEAELKHLILQQEEKIRVELVKLRDLIDKDVRVIIKDQMEKLTSSNPDYKLDLTAIRLRVDENISKHLDKASKVLNSAVTEYTRIFDELNVNRLPQPEINRVRDKVLEPLQKILVLRTGELAEAQQATNDAHALLRKHEEEYEADLGKNVLIPLKVRNEHLANLRTMQDKNDLLVKRLNAIIDVIGNTVGFEALKSEIAAIAEEQKRTSQALEQEQDRIQKQILKALEDIGGK